jgi:hypothetical protein
MPLGRNHVAWELGAHGRQLKLLYPDASDACFSVHFKNTHENRLQSREDDGVWRKKAEPFRRASSKTDGSHHLGKRKQFGGGFRNRYSSLFMNREGLTRFTSTLRHRPIPEVWVQSRNAQGRRALHIFSGAESLETNLGQISP